MKIAEIFYSMQGEGILAGVPSVYVRTSGTSPRPTWCDVPVNSWTPNGTDVGYGPILSQVRRHWCGYVVVTGSEPMLDEEIEILSAKLKEIEHHVTVETCGTVFNEITCDLLSITPELGAQVPLDTLKELTRRYDYQLKFALETQDDLADIREVVTAIEADPKKVLLMPEATRLDVLMDRSRWLVEVCKNLNFRFCPRLQISAGRDRRS